MKLNDKINVCVYTHYFKISTQLYPVIQFIEDFCFKYKQWGLFPERGRMVRKPMKNFYWHSYDKRQWRLHIGVYEKFMAQLKLSYYWTQLSVEKKDLFPTVSVKHVIREMYKDRDYQTPAVEFLSGPPIQVGEIDYRSKLLRFRTGRGKSYTCMRAAQVLGKRSLYLVRATYVDKWVEDLSRTYVLEKDEIEVAQGGTSSIRKIIERAVKNKNKKTKVYVVSMDSYKAWIRSYSNGDNLKDIGYLCDPDEFYEVLGVGLRVLDEVHQHFHAYYVQDLFAHVPNSIGLSATLISKDPFLRNRYDEMFPPHTRYRDDAAIVYAQAQAVHFMFDKPQFIRTHEWGNTQWSHNAYEESIYKHKPTLWRYLNMISGVIKNSFGRVKRQKKKLLILAFRIDMIDAIVEEMKRIFPELDVQRFVTGSDYATCMASDIIVSTYGKAGTAIDIPDLTNLFVTVNMAADHANMQIVGRLRMLGDNHPVLMQCLVADNIDKCVANDKARRTALIGYVTSYTDYVTNAVI